MKQFSQLRTQTHTHRRTSVNLQLTPPEGRSGKNEASISKDSVEIAKTWP